MKIKVRTLRKLLREAGPKTRKNLHRNPKGQGYTRDYEWHYMGDPRGLRDLDAEIELNNAYDDRGRLKNGPVADDWQFNAPAATEELEKPIDYKEIADELGYSGASGAYQAEFTGMEKFKALWNMEEQERKKYLENAARAFIEKLIPNLDREDIEFMRANIDHVIELDSFRDFCRGTWQRRLESINTGTRPVPWTLSSI